MKIHRKNLIVALETAIETQEKYEKEILHYKGDSCQLVGWRMFLEMLRNGESVEIIGDAE